MLDLCNLRDVVYMVIMVSLVILVTLVEHYLRSPCNAILGVCAIAQTPKMARAKM